MSRISRPLSAAWRGLKFAREWYRGPAVEVTTSRAFALYDRLRGQPYKPVDFQIRVENLGSMTVYDLRASIYFHGIIDSEGTPSTITVDTRGTWEQNNESSTSLHGGESEWLNVLRVVQDYSAAERFDVDTDVYVIFPTNEGWDQPARIRMKPDPSMPSLTRSKLTRNQAKNLIWQEARIEIVGEDRDSNEVSIDYDIDLADLRKKMDNRAGFFKDSDMST